MVRLKKVYIANWVMLFIFANFLSACRLGRQPTPTPIPINLPLPNSTPSAPTETYTVQPGEVVQDEVFSGRVTSAREEDLFFRRSGQVTTVYVEDGDLVEQGDLIATLDNEVLEIDLESALLGLAIAKENLADAQKSLEYRRQQAALNLTIAKLIYTASDEVRVEAPNGVTDSSALAEIRQRQVELAQLNLDAIETTVDPVLELNVKRAELSVDRVKQQILEGQIEAPYTGEIRFINLPENGEQLAVQGYAAVARIVDATQLKVELNLPRTQLESLSEGMPVEISAASLGSKTLPGVIDALPRPFGTSQGSLMEVVLTNSEDNAALREGITVAVNVRLKSKPDALTIPRSALHEENQLYYVTVQEGETVHRVTVAVGVIGEDLVEIVAGLEAGETVVVGL